jgi:hypothetical protein
MVASAGQTERKGSSERWGVAALLAVQGCSSDSGSGIISDAQFRSVKIGSQEATLRSEFGSSLSSDNIPVTLPVPPGDECLYYLDDGTTIDGTTYRFCFKAGVLDLKDGYGPLFDSGTVHKAPS